jgi:hypothetical protein
MDRTLEALPPRSVAIVQGFGRPLNRSLVIGGAVTIAVATVLVAIGVGDTLGWVIAPFVIGALAGLVGALVAILVVPRRIRRAFEAYSWLGHAEVERFKERTGSPVPNKVAAMEQWLAATPSTPTMRLPRIELLAFLGRYAEAIDELAKASEDLGNATPVDPERAFEIASLRQYIDWLEQGSDDLTALRTAAAELPAGSAARRSSAVTIAVSQARIGLVNRDQDWTAPLEAVRGDLGSAPWRATIVDTWRPVWFLLGLVGLITALVVPLLRATL